MWNKITNAYWNLNLRLLHNKWYMRVSLVLAVILTCTLLLPIHIAIAISTKQPKAYLRGMIWIVKETYKHYC